MPRRPGRPPGNATLLTRGEIFAAALRLIDSDGVAALSMRRLAQALNVDPMAIYHHVAGKDALLAGVVESVFQELATPSTPDEDWCTQIRAFAHAYRALARRHPNLVVELITRTDVAPEVIQRTNEALYAALLRSGLAPRRVLAAADLLIDFIHGYELAEETDKLMTLQARQAELQALVQRTPAQYPAHAEVAAGLANEEGESAFDAELSIILAGVAALSGDSRCQQ